MKKKTIKIGFDKFGCDPENNFFTNLLKKDYDVKIDQENPDFVIFSTGHATSSPTLRKTVRKIPILRKYSPQLRQFLCELPFFGRIFSDKIAMKEVEMPILDTKAKKIFYAWGICRPHMSRCDWAFTEDYDEDLKNPRHMRLPWYKYYCNSGKELIKPGKIDFEKMIKEKTKFCNFIYQNNAPFRNKFFKSLSKYKKVDAPGRCMNNSEPIPSLGKTIKLSQPGQKGEVDWQKAKVEYLKQYKFTIAMETKDFHGYVSEKLYQPMLANSIPIYWGNRFVDRDFNTKSFINYWDYDKIIRNKIPSFLLKIPAINLIIERGFIEPLAIKKMIKKIIEIDKDDKLYESILKEPWFYDNKLSKYCDDNQYRKQFKKIFG